MDVAATLVNNIWDHLHMLTILLSCLQLSHHSANNLHYVTNFHKNLIKNYNATKSTLKVPPRAFLVKPLFVVKYL